MTGGVRRGRTVRAVIAAGLVAATGAAGLTVGQSAASAATTPTSFTTTKTVTRSNLDAQGKSTTVDSHTVHLTVSQTTGLRGRQDISVSWTGAHPTGAIQPDLNSVVADQQEYPMVLVECRGVDNTSAPASQRVDPSTCWTHGSDARYHGIGYTHFAPWRLDRYGTTATRQAVVNRPKSAQKLCGDAVESEYWQPFRALDGTSYYYGNQSCAGIPPEDFNFDTSAQVVPQNATFAPTRKDGTGSTKFDVWTDQENASLGCNAQVACTLEAIPVEGISCDPYGKASGIPASTVPGPTDTDSDSTQAAANLCEAKGQYNAGDLVNPSQGVDLAVSGALWWSASNWRNRIAVPLSFAPVSTACSQTGGGAPVGIYGSELLNEATAQWGPYFCLDPKLFKFTHVQTAEPLAQRLMQDPTSGVDAAFASRAPDPAFTTPTVQAPVAATGFSISYTIDNGNQEPVTNLRLTPRLLAKLLTESYPGDKFDRFAPDQFGNRNPDGTAGSGIHDNPVNITEDPEFEALNPDIHVDFGQAGPAALIVLSAESDVTWALTDYINSDPEARAWLDGKPDPWGMVVNHNYVGMKLPVLRWPLLDTTLPNFAHQVPCAEPGEDPAPWLPLIESPTPALATTAVDVQFASSPGKSVCSLTGDFNDPSSQIYQWVSAGRMQPGYRFVIGVTSLGEAQRYDLSSAALQTSSDATDFEKQFSDGKGRTFVQPTDASLRAAAKHVTKDQSAKLFTTDASSLAGDKKAYPGFMLVDADVPTSGLSKQQRTDYANFLTFAARRGQQPGLGNGDLPAGYLPLTSANGLGALASYTQRAATAVRTQSGQVPGLDPEPATPTGTTSSADSAAGTGSGGGGGGGGIPTGGGDTGVPATATTTAPATSSSAAPKSSSVTPVAASFRTPNNGIGAAGLILPLILGVAALGGLLACGAAYQPRRKR